MSGVDTHLRRAVRALAGLDDAALDAVTPDAMRAVLLRHGWTRGADERGMLDSRLLVAETYVCGQDRAPVSVRVLPSLTDETRRMFVTAWAENAACQFGDVAPAEVLAETLAVVAAAQHTGIAASWCPVCGTCTCPRGRGSWGDREPDAACPLHGDASAHEDGPVEP